MTRYPLKRKPPLAESETHRPLVIRYIERIPVVRCRRCFHEWLVRADAHGKVKWPVRCPSCGSPKWDSVRMGKDGQPLVADGGGEQESPTVGGEV